MTPYATVTTAPAVAPLRRLALVSDLSVFVSGVVGLLGVGVGLAGDVLRRHWQRPKLELKHYSLDGGDGVYSHNIADDAEEAYLRLRVHNSGRTTARSVEVAVEHVEPLDMMEAPDSTRAAFAPQDTALLLGRRLKWADRDEPQVDIPSGSARRVDIAHITTAEPRYLAGDVLSVPMRITLSKPSRINRHILAGTGYRVTVSITGENCQSHAFRLDLTFGGRWLGRSTLTAAPDAFTISSVEATALSHT